MKNEPHAANALICDFAANSHTLLILFGGIASNVGIPSFEFFNLTATIPIQTQHLKKFARLHPCQEGGHRLVKHLRDINKLKPILQNALTK